MLFSGSRAAADGGVVPTQVPRISLPPSHSLWAFLSGGGWGGCEDADPSQTAGWHLSCNHTRQCDSASALPHKMGGRVLDDAYHPSVNSYSFLFQTQVVNTMCGYRTIDKEVMSSKSREGCSSCPHPRVPAGAPRGGLLAAEMSQHLWL